MQRLLLLFIIMTYQFSLSAQEILQNVEKKDGEALRQLMYDLVEASHPSYKTTGQRIQKMNEVFQKHQELIQWVLSTENPQQLLDQAELPINLTSESFNKSFKGKLVQMLLQLVKLNPLKFKILHPIRNKMASLVSALHPEKLISKNLLNNLADQINDYIENTKLSETKLMKNLLDPDHGFALKKLPEEYQNLVQQLFVNYFDNIDFYLKRRMMLSYLKTPVGSSVEDKILSVLQGAGPILQKILQLIGTDFEEPSIVNLLDKLKNQVEPDSPEKVKQIIQDSLGHNIIENIIEMNEKPLGSGTIAQVHMARYKDLGKPEKDVVIKIQHMYALDAVNKELALFERIPLGHLGKQLLEKTKEIIFKEMDFRKEHANIQNGKLTYENKIEGIEVASTIDGIKPASKVLFLKKAEGTSLLNLMKKSDESLKEMKLYKQQMLRHTSQRMNELLGLWLNSAIIQPDGFFHADLHGGNLFVAIGPQYPGYSKLTMIDFGSVGNLSADEQKAIVYILLGSVTYFPDKVFEGIELLYKDFFKGREQLKEAVKALILSSASVDTKINSLLKIFVDEKVGLPANIFMFHRGFKFLMDQINDINQQIERNDPAGQIPRVSLVSIFSKAIIQPLLQQTTSNLIKKNSNIKTSALSVLKDLSRYGWQAFREVTNCETTKVGFVKNAIQSGAENLITQSLKKISDWFDFGDVLEEMEWTGNIE